MASSVGAGKPGYLVFILSALLLLSAGLLHGCGGGESPGDGSDEVAEAAAAFLDACGNLQPSEARSLMSSEYISTNQVPDPLTPEQLTAALGYLNSYHIVPSEDINVEEERATVTVDLDISGVGEREEILVMALEGGEWKVDGFTAMDWTSMPETQPEEEYADVEVALREFVIACLDGDTKYIFEHLSPGYLETHRLEKPWTSAEFSGVFGTARSYDFKAQDIEVDDDRAEVDLTIEFGTRGNLESETSRVRLVKAGNDWLVDSFPFFIY